MTGGCDPLDAAQQARADTVELVDEIFAMALNQVEFAGMVICAHCVAEIHETYDRRLPLRVYDSDGTDHTTDIVHPLKALHLIRQGREVCDDNSLAYYGPAVTTVAGTAVCGRHAYNEIRTRP